MKKTFNTLYVVSYGAIGDFVMLLYFLERAHRANPTMHIVVLTTAKPALLTEMAAAYPFVAIKKITPYTFIETLWAGVKNKNFFLIPPTFVDVPLFITILARFATVRGILAGFVGTARVPRLDLAIPFETKKLFYQNFSALLTRLGWPADGDLHVSFAQDVAILTELPKQYVAIEPAASNPGKTLSPARWAKLIRFIHTHYPQYGVVLLGGPGQTLVAEKVAQEGGGAQVVCGIPFAQTIAVLRGAECFIGADSGLTHVAGALGIRSVIVDNLRAVTWLPTYNPHAVILTESKNCVCGGDKTGDCNYVIEGVSYLRCMWDVSDERIAEAVQQMISHNL